MKFTKLKTNMPFILFGLMVAAIITYIFLHHWAWIEKIPVPKIKF